MDILEGMDFSILKKRTVFLPDDIWEHIFTFLLNDAAVDHHRRHCHFLLDSLSLVSKQFLSITNRLKLSLTICDPTSPSLPRLFRRFPNLNSLDLTHFQRGDLHVLLRRINRSSLDIRSIKLCNRPTIPADWLRSFAEKMKNLTSLTCSEIDSLMNADLVLISDCFPLLEELDLSFPKDNGKNVVIDVNLKLPKLRKVNLSGHFYFKDESLFYLCRNCEFLEEVVMSDCQTLTHAGIASAISQRPSLRSFSVKNYSDIKVSSQFICSLVKLNGLTSLDLSQSCISDPLLYSIAEKRLPLRKLVLQGCRNYTYDGIFYLLSKSKFLQHLGLGKARFLNDQHIVELSIFLAELVSVNVNGCQRLTHFALIAFVTNCPALNEIRMEGARMGKGCVLWDYRILKLNGFFDLNPNNYQVKSLHLAYSSLCLCNEKISKLASIFCNLQLLDLSSSYHTSEFIVTFCNNSEVHSFPKLEVLNLSSSNIDDKTLYVISKSFCGLLQLDLENCRKVTYKGVMQVVENCIQLREINLRKCSKVAYPFFIAWMVLARPSLRKIMAPPCFSPTGPRRKFFLRYGCLVC